MISLEITDEKSGFMLEIELTQGIKVVEVAVLNNKFRWPSFQNVAFLGPKEMTQSIKCLLCKNDDLGWIL